MIPHDNPRHYTTIYKILLKIPDTILQTILQTMYERIPDTILQRTNTRHYLMKDTCRQDTLKETIQLNINTQT